jgi:hypothetical protein
MAEFSLGTSFELPAIRNVDTWKAVRWLGTASPAGRLRAASIIAVVAEEHDGQGVFVAADAAALGNVAVLAPRLVELPAALLTGGLLNSVQGLVADDARLQFVLGGFQILGDTHLFCHYPEINSLSR